jgi:hypothetical protein
LSLIFFKASLLNSHPGCTCALWKRKNRALVVFERERERVEHKKLELARVRDLKKA